MDLRLWKLGAAVAAVAGLWAAAVPGPSVEAAGDLVLKRFLLGRIESGSQEFIATGGRGTTNAFRNNVIMLVFSGPVDPASFDKRTVRIGIPASGGLFIDADGLFTPYETQYFNPVGGADSGGAWETKRKYKNRVIFDPTKQFADKKEDRTPYGFAENSTFSVTLPGLDSGTLKTVRGRSGSYLRSTFTTTFRTTDKYLQDFTQPTVLKVEGSDAPGVPLAGRTSVDSKADVIAFFSEPMLVAAFDPSSTFRVFNFGQGRSVTGTIRPAPDGESFTFRPVFGYGRGPYDVSATLTTGLQDRSGNFLDKGVVVNFTTENDPFAPNFDEEIEAFDTTTFQDTAFVPTIARAAWNTGPTGLGVLAGVFGSQSFDLVYGGTGGHGIPWWNSTSHTQWLYLSANIGSTPRTISRFRWRYYTTGVPLGATYQGTLVLMGHNTSGSLPTNFTGGYSDTPVTVVTSTAYSPSTSEAEWVSGPSFTSNFPYNGKDNIILDISTASGSGSSVNYWRYNPTSTAVTALRSYTSGGTPVAPTTYAWNHDVRFHYQVDNSEARSLWYDTTVNNPTYLDPVVLQSTPPGTSISILYQGGLENVNQPGTVDSTSLSAWTSDPENDLQGFRFIRFYVDMTSNIGSATRPVIDEIRLPFTYF